MEEFGATIPKYQPLRDLWHSLCDYTRQTILSHPILSFTRELVPSLFEAINNLKFIEIGSAILLISQPYKVLPFTTKIFKRQLFFFLSFYLSSFSFIVHFFRGLAGACMNPGSFFQTFFLYIHLFV